MNRLYSPNPAEREAEAKKYRVFHKNVRIPRKWKKDWDELLRDRGLKEGRSWPDSLLNLMRNRKWPEYTFGTANASCLVVLHRPGKPANENEDTYIVPRLPVLGGISHAHNALWRDKLVEKGSTDRTWGSMHKYLPDAFDTLEDRWSQIMTTNLTTIPARPGQVDAQSNLQAVNGGLLDFLVELCKPRIILLCGGDVQKAARDWARPPGIRILECNHPQYQFGV